MKKEIKLYNVLFPLWLLLLFPQMWLVVLIGNYIIDSLVLFVAMKILKIEEKLNFYKKVIGKIFVFGLCADVVGSVVLFYLVIKAHLGTLGDEPYLTIPALILSGACIFILNYFITFRKNEKKLRMTLSLTFAIATAPYTFLIPSAWLYAFS